MNGRENPRLPFTSGRTRERIKADMLKKLDEGKTKDFDSEEAVAYSEELDRERVEQLNEDIAERARERREGHAP